MAASWRNRATASRRTRPAASMSESLTRRRVTNARASAGLLMVVSSTSSLDRELVPDDRELRHREVDVVERVGSRELGADPVLPTRNNWEGEADRVHAARPEPLGKRSGTSRVPHHDGDDRVSALDDVEAGLPHRATEARRVRPELVAQLRRPFDELDRLQAGRGDRRSDAVREQVRPGALAEELDDLPAPRDIPARSAAHRLAKRAREDIDALGDRMQLGRATAVR